MGVPVGYSLEAQLERTVLAWNRSALAIAANGALLVREGLERELNVVTFSGFAIIGTAAVVWLLSTTSYARAHDQRATHLLARRGRFVLALMVFAVLISLTDIVLVSTA